MIKRRYTKIQLLLPVIEEMIASGMSHREIERKLGLEGDRPIHNPLKRQRRKEKMGKPKYRGNCYDNAMAENFFSILKTECIYRHLPATFDEARTLIDNYIYFYNHLRIQLKTGVAPLTLRHSA